MTKRWRIEVSRIARVRQVAIWEGEAETPEDADDVALASATDGSLNWLDDDDDGPEWEDQSVCTTEPEDISNEDVT